MCSSLEFPPLLFSCLLRLLQNRVSSWLRELTTTRLLEGSRGKTDKGEANCDQLVLESQESQRSSPGVREFTVDTHRQLARP